MALDEPQPIYETVVLRVPRMPHESPAMVWHWQQLLDTPHDVEVGEGGIWLSGNLSDGYKAHLCVDIDAALEASGEGWAMSVTSYRVPNA